MKQTMKAAKLEAIQLDMTIRKRDGEYRVNWKGAKDRHAYYTTDLLDAVNTMRAMAMLRRGTEKARADSTTTPEGS